MTHLVCIHLVLSQVITTAFIIALFLGLDETYDPSASVKERQ